MKGIKVQLSARESQAIGIKHIEAAKVASRDANVPVLMHLSDTAGRERGITPPQTMGQAVSLMYPGDAIIHVFTPNSGSTMDQDGKILPEVLDVQRRGAFIDSANDGNNFGWAEADPVMSLGLVPNIIASDKQITYRPTLLRSLLEYSSFYLHLGFSVDDVVRLMTVTPARFLRIEDHAGSLALGRDADIAVMDSFRWPMAVGRLHWCQSHWLSGPGTGTYHKERPGYRISRGTASLGVGAAHGGFVWRPSITIFQSGVMQLTR